MGFVPVAVKRTLKKNTKNFFFFEMRRRIGKVCEVLLSTSRKAVHSLMDWLKHCGWSPTKHKWLASSVVLVHLHTKMVQQTDLSRVTRIPLELTVGSAQVRLFTSEEKKMRR